jgi:hypothetical protein
VPRLDAGIFFFSLLSSFVELGGCLSGPVRPVSRQAGKGCDAILSFQCAAIGVLHALVLKNTQTAEA